MSIDFTPIKNTSDLQLCEQAEAKFNEGNYTESIELYEQAIETNSTQINYYWRLGLALLLAGKEEAAQITWMTPTLEAESEAQQQQWITELVQELETEAKRQVDREAYESAWLICQHLREFAPDNLENLLNLLQLSLQTNVFSFQDDLLEQVIEALRDSSPLDCDRSEFQDTVAIGEQLLYIAQLLLEHNPTYPKVLLFLQTCLPYWSTPSLQLLVIDLLTKNAKALHDRSMHNTAAHIARLCIDLVPDDVNLLFKVLHLVQHGDVESLRESIKLAERCIALSTDWVDKIMATSTLLESWIFSGGNWQHATEIYQDYKTLLCELVELVETQSSQEPSSDEQPDVGLLHSLLPLGGVSFYFEDEPRANRSLRNQVAQIAQTHLRATLQEEFTRYQNTLVSRKTKPLHRRLPRIGYLASSFRKHSVGWLCRWLFSHHNRDRFDVHIYSSRSSEDFIQRRFAQEYGDRFHTVPSVVADIANQIHDDGIDILVELDSLTSLGGCGTVALKPAPIQVHWLGYDASGIPAVDYFIADPYVLPEDAQDYYSETIWRLPQTYIAVDGFEVHTPTLRRDQLGIPGDAIVYLSSQTGMKRNTENARLQLQILKEVPNSYFLVKSFRAIPEFIETFFRELAEAEGVSVDRLRFLPDVPSEFSHRANLGLADVVLDTYPYNGATTTLEALWMGLPIVTLVGQQFAARNSYTMMMNTGITEGIAWSNEEYLEWGIRLGTDANLRKDIFYRLQRSRHSSPLWNGKQFAHEMESAYEQMWKRYLES